MYSPNYILVPVLILIILVYIYSIFGYIYDSKTKFRKKKTTQCILNECDKHYHFIKSQNQLQTYKSYLNNKFIY
jgi:hypothetical protein